MKYQRNGKEHEINSTGMLMSTGKVAWMETVGTSIASLIVGSGLTYLILWATSL